MPPNTPLIWLLIDDRPGNSGQVRGVAEALAGLLDAAGISHRIIEKKIEYTSLVKLPNIVRGATLVGVTSKSSLQLVAPWPDVVIAAGRRAAPVARWVKKMAQRGQRQRALAVQLMNPGRAGAPEFDLIAIPKHDCAKPLHSKPGEKGGDPINVFRTVGAPHKFSPKRLEQERQSWAGTITGIPRPYIALFVGGATKSKPFPPELATDLGNRISQVVQQTGGSVLLTTSRRTGEAAEEALQASIIAPHFLYIWSRQGQSGAPNPYAGFLALADAVVVTGDSVSMCSEATANTGPVYIYAPDGMVAPKHARLHRDLYAAGLAKPFTGTYEEWSHPPHNAADAVAARIVELLQQ
jgi:mitochondrial fission protein ELM1